MDSRLTLKLNSRSINRAKNYVSKHKNISLSILVQSYFDSLTSNAERTRTAKVPPIVSSLAGVLQKRVKTNIEAEYTDFLIEKYK
jgi:hypothetical protein